MKTKKLAFPICILLVLFYLFIGALIGLSVSLISNIVYLVFLFPIIIGFAGAYFLKDAVKRCRIRSNAVALALSILVGLVIYSTFHVVNYFTFQTQALSELVLKFNNNDSTASLIGEETMMLARATLDYALTEETGRTGFLGYMLLEAKVGVTIGKVTSSSSINLGPIFTWVYWLVELGLIIGIMYTLTKNKERDALCEQCEGWITPKEHLGGVEEQDFQSLQDLIATKNFSAAGQLLSPSTGIPSIEVYAKSCNCPTGDLKLSQTSFDTNNDVIWTDILTTTIRLDQLDELRQNKK